MNFISPEWKIRFPNLVCVQSTRLNGFSINNYSGLNLGYSSGDEKLLVKKNRAYFWNELGIKEEDVALANQIHSNNVLITDKPGNFENYDAIVSIKPGVFAAVSIADCTPILIFDSENGYSAAVHAGWRGTAAEITKLTAEKLINLGSAPDNMFAFIGACISKENFEVGIEVAEQFNFRFVSKGNYSGKFFVDLKEANKHQLTTLGIPPENIEVSPYCTYANPDLFYSYRRQKGITGRMLAVIGIKN